MQIQQIEIEKIIPYTQNTRKHSDAQISRIAQSITEFGFNQPIVIDEKNIVLVGHGRLSAAKKLGLARVPTLKLNALSDAQKRAYRILDNKIHEESQWDFDALQTEVELLQVDEYNVDDWGLDEYLGEIPGSEERETVVDEPHKTESPEVQCPQCGHFFKLEKYSDES